MSRLSSGAGRLINRTLPTENWILWGAIVLCLGLQVHLQFVQKINWDEFYFLSMIYEHQRGQLSKPLQTLHVHLFAWLTAVGKDEIQQVEIARFCMWLFEIGTLILVFLTSRLFCSRQSSLLGVLCFICSGYVLMHGTSFRADPMAAFFSMLCIYLLAGSKLSYKSLLLMGCAVAVAIHITVKVVFFLPLFLWLGLWQLSQFKRPFEAIKRLSIAAFFCVFVGLVIYEYQLQVMPSNASKYSSSIVASAPSTVLFKSGFLPRWNFIKESALLSIPQLSLLLIGVTMCFYQVVYSRQLRANAIVLLGMLIPLFSLLFYRNAFPYYFPFIFPPSICVIAYGASLADKKNYLVLFLVVVLVANHLVSYFERMDEGQESQQGVISFLHEAFPQGVNYIDRCSMFSSAKKIGYFMSSWGHASYRKNAQSVIRMKSMNEVIPVVIANNSKLKHALEVGADNSIDSLLYSDAEFLKTNYVHHWGYVWVAGFELSLSPDNLVINVGVPGTYTVESELPITIDGKNCAVGDTVNLDRGLKSVTSNISQQIILRWGDNLYMPVGSPSEKPVFSKF